jgi:hypothetical protein
MRGIDQLIRMRQGGKKPDAVFVNFFGEFKTPKLPAEFKLMQLRYAPCHDLRPFVGLKVILHAKTWAEDVAKAYEALQAHASEIHVLVEEFEIDIGFFWTKQGGQVSYGN